jgi:hypothetical protein
MIGRSSVAGRSAVTTMHWKPASSAHVEEQPSPLRLLPSSQASLGNLRPSPHTAVQVPFAQTGSTVQVGEQPS